MSANKSAAVMATTGDGIFRGVFEGCISGHDTGIQRRPYHRNCSCALHKSRGYCNHVSKNKNVSYPIRRSWSEGSLAIMASANSSPSNSPSSSPVAAPDLRRSSRRLVPNGRRDEEEEDPVSSKV